MLFKLPVVLAMALLTLGASASERFTVTSLRRRDQPGDYPQDRGSVKSPTKGQQLKVNERFAFLFNPISVGDLVDTLDVEVFLKIKSLNYSRRLVTNLMSPGDNKPIVQNFIFMHPKGSHVKAGTILPGTIEVFEQQNGTKSYGNSNYFLNQAVDVKFQF
ncbi:BQ5605_C010g06164 [Microbotryum silenes-dioicae]|uniref:BQ5605_C010g06164 protein n=1 Tax=Microbotryum silenes-dioicae TaxID=796604 RepID=A0A2X0MJY3_9BASI|nr:BQ5605_C010g06164 [Microbotryum silenes-dioicae]